mgnify:CR=1 FL=1
MLTLTEVEKAQQLWGEGIVKIAQAYSSGIGYEKLARQHVESLYAHETSTVLFKPTLAVNQQFRTTFEGAVSYFIGGNIDFPEDEGFAIKGWTNVRFENKDYIFYDNYALAMGNYYFMNQDGNEIKVEFSFGYIVGTDNSLRINLHHSSLPAIKK